MFKNRRLKASMGIGAAVVACTALFASPAAAREHGRFPTNTDCLRSVTDLARNDSPPGDARLVLRYSNTCNTFYAEAVGFHGSKVEVLYTDGGLDVGQSGTVNNYYPGLMSRGYSRMLDRSVTSRAHACLTYAGISHCTRTASAP